MIIVLFACVNFCPEATVVKDSALYRLWTLWVNFTLVFLSFLQPYQDCSKSSENNCYHILRRGRGRTILFWPAVYFTRLIWSFIEYQYLTFKCTQFFFILYCLPCRIQCVSMGNICSKCYCTVGKNDSFMRSR